MYSERDRLRTSLLSSVTVLQIHNALGIYSNWLQARVRLRSPSCRSGRQFDQVFAANFQMQAMVPLVLACKGRIRLLQAYHILSYAVEVSWSTACKRQPAASND